MNVHAADPETHVVTHGDQLNIKPLVTTEPRAVSTALNLLAGWLQKVLTRFVDEWSIQETPVGQHLALARMRFVGKGDGTIPAELHPEEWEASIRVTQAPMADILEEAAQLVMVIANKAQGGITEAELRERTGLDALSLGEHGHAILRSLLDGLVALGALRVDDAVKPRRYHAPPASGGS